MTTYTVKNWRTFQHYTGRRPPWIKLQKTLLDDMDFQCLPIASKALAPMLWLLASENAEGKIDCDVQALAWRLRWPVKDITDGLTPLIDKGFLIDASNTLAGCLQDAMPETEGEGETEEPTQANACVGKPAAPACPPCPADELIALYHEVLPTLPRVLVRNKTRDAYLRARWKQFFEEGDFKTKEEGIECFRWFFAERVKPSKFLTGQAEGHNGKRPFVADLEWITRPTNFSKIIEGRYAQ